jgi:hypothetical protein
MLSLFLVLVLIGGLLVVIGEVIRLFGTRRNMYGQIIKRDKR